MSTTYLDTSALAKWYLNEAHSDEVEEWLGRHGPVAISSLTLVEMRSLLARRRRAGDLDAKTEARVLATFDDDVRRGYLVCHAVHDRSVTASAGLFAQVPDQPLRTLDALHLACARDIGARGFATADRVQAAAAEALGLEVTRFAT